MCLVYVRWPKPVISSDTNTSGWTIYSFVNGRDTTVLQGPNRNVRFFFLLFFFFLRHELPKPVSMLHGPYVITFLWILCYSRWKRTPIKRKTPISINYFLCKSNSKNRVMITSQYRYHLMFETYLLAFYYFYSFWTKIHNTVNEISRIFIFAREKQSTLKPRIVLSEMI